MSVLRHVLGMLIVLLADMISNMAHRLIHIGAWLLDRKEVNADCPTCQERAQ